MCGVNRRGFLSTIALGGVGLLSGCTRSPAGPALAGVVSAPSPQAPPPPLFLPPPNQHLRQPLPSHTLTALPGDGHYLALTVDDGVSSDTVGGYIAWAQRSGMRLTFFVTACYDSWTDHKAALRPLVESGQIQLGNHTWSHADLTSLSSSGVAAELTKTKNFLRREFGVDGTPYFRPPYGFHNATVDAVAADLGYTVPTLWYGSLADSGLVTEDFITQCAEQYFLPQHIVIGHANHAPVTHVYPALEGLLRGRRLAPVTLNDYFHTSK